MADQIPFEYQTEFGQAAEQEKLAQLMAQLRAQGRPQGQMVSGHYVRASPMQHLADVFAAWQQGKTSREAAALKQATLAKMASAQSGEASAIDAAMQGRPEQAGPVDPWNPTELAAVDPNPIAAAMMAARSPFEANRKRGDDIRSMVQNQTSAFASRMTPEGMQQFSRTGYAKPEMFRPEERYGPIENLAPEGQDPILGAREERTGKPIFAPKPAQQTVSVGDKTEGLILAQASKDFREKPFRDRIQNLKTTLDASTAAWRLVDEGKLNLGVDSDIKTFAQKLGSVLGLPVDTRAPATELYKTFIIPQVGRIITMFGAGTGLSDADREFAKQAVALATNDPRMLPVALAFAMRGASKELQAVEQERLGYVEMAKGANVHPNAFGPEIGWSFQVPKGASQTFPANPYEPGALETWGMQQLYGTAPAAPAGASVQPGSPEDIARRYLPGARK